MIVNHRTKKYGSVFLQFLLIIICFSSCGIVQSMVLQVKDISTEDDDKFPFVGQYNKYDVTQTVGGLIGSAGTLAVSYHSMLNETAIYGTFHVEITSIIQFYNETASGNENLNTRHLYINSEDTYMIYLFMEYFFIWEPGVVTPTPMWIFPQDIQINKTIKFWNYYGNCSKSQSISIMNKYYEVFVFRIYGIDLNMTLMYGYARHGQSDWYGLLFYMNAAFYDHSRDLMLYAYFKLSYTNAELLPLGEINKKNVTSIAISIYSLIIVGTIVYRVKSRKELIGGEI